MQLWSGFIGSVVGAVAAALVALLVVWLTNRHQSSLADEAAAKQAEVIEKELEAQRVALASQLTHQQESLNRQLKDQRLEARRERERSAMAVIIGGLTVLRSEVRNSEFDDRPQMGVVAAGIHRWRLELGSDPLAEELALWPKLIWVANRHARTSLANDASSGEHARKVFVQYVDFLREICIRWSSSESDEYGNFMNEMADFRGLFDDRVAGVAN